MPYGILYSTYCIPNFLKFHIQTSTENNWKLTRGKLHTTVTEGFTAQKHTLTQSSYSAPSSDLVLVDKIELSIVKLFLK